MKQTHKIFNQVEYILLKNYSLIYICVCIINYLYIEKNRELLRIFNI